MESFQYLCVDAPKIRAITVTQKTFSSGYKALCSEFYDLDKPSAPKDALAFYLEHSKRVKGPILEPMCGTGNFLIPIAQAGYQVTGFDNSRAMLDICRNKIRTQQVSCNLLESDFQRFKPEKLYNLVMIPLGSFCLLIDEVEVDLALNSIHAWLHKEGKFILEIETLYAKSEALGFWQARSVKKPDGSLIVLNYTSQFDEDAAVQITLCRYEHWKDNQIIQTEAEKFQLKLYNPDSFQKTLEKNGFEVIQYLEPYHQSAKSGSLTVLYECRKKKVSENYPSN